MSETPQNLLTKISLKILSITVHVNLGQVILAGYLPFLWAHPHALAVVQFWYCSYCINTSSC